MNEISVRLARANNSQTSFNFKLGHTRPTGLNARLPFRSITMRRLSHSGSKRKDCFSYVLGKHSLSMRAFILFYMQTRRCELSCRKYKTPAPTTPMTSSLASLSFVKLFRWFITSFNFFLLFTINQVKFVMKPITWRQTWHIIISCIFSITSCERC